MAKIYGVGIREEGVYKSSENNKHTKLYTLWKNMLARCYSGVMHEHRSTYEQCEVAGDFIYFQKFAAWYEAQVIDKSVEYQLDKDLLNKGNKIYSETTCVLVPRKINMFLCKSEAKRGDYPIGVSIHKQTNRPIAQVADSIAGGRTKRAKLCNTVEEAYTFYKDTKEVIAKELAELYKDKCDNIVIEALLNYRVEVTD